MRVLVLLLVSVLVGCGAADQPRTAPVGSDLDVDPEKTVAVADHVDVNDPDRNVDVDGDGDGDGRGHPRRRWTGKPIDLDVKEADLHNVFRLLAEVGNVSIVVADDVRGDVTLRLRSVPWDQALDTVVRLEKLSLRRDGTVYTVSRSSSSSSSASSPP